MSLTSISSFVIAVYAASLALLLFYGLHRYWIIFLYWRYGKISAPTSPTLLPSVPEPMVTIQLPIYNEMFVVERLINAVTALDYPREKLEIQILDDSTDETVQIVDRCVGKLVRAGLQIHHLRRPHRLGFKAGALNYGLERATGEFVAIFDADFVPPPGFLRATIPCFQNPQVGMVQTRWGHINADYSLLTRLQALLLDGHFLLEHTARHKSGAFFNFNGTAGIWRKEAIASAGGWSSRSLTEDLDLSYRAQLNGWKFVYIPDFVCPAELPVDIHAFRSQQRRWTKGSIQVARYLIKDLWTSSIPFRVKLEATAHLTANLGYLLTVLVSVLLLPSLLLRHQFSWSGIEMLEIGVFLMTSVSIFLFYAVSQREIYPNWKWKMRDIVALMSFGIGMCVSNALAVCEGLIGRDSEFVRTPKYNLKTRHDRWRKKIYKNRDRNAWIVPSLFAIYSMITFVAAVMLNDWMAIPFIFLFLTGFAYVASLCFARRSA